MWPAPEQVRSPRVEGGLALGRMMGWEGLRARIGLWEHNPGSVTVELASRSLTCSSHWCGLHLSQRSLLRRGQGLAPGQVRSLGVGGVGLALGRMMR